MTPVLVLGGSGMLGSMLVNQLAQRDDIQLTVSARNGLLADKRQDAVDYVTFDALEDDVGRLLAPLEHGTWIVNAIGIIKPHIDESDSSSRRQALEINGVFPHRLADAAREAEARVIQIATDCVFSGSTGLYDESCPHDALDVYGKTKSLGEAPSDSMLHLRASIIGPEWQRHVSLLDWFRGLPQNAQVTGFENHRWNGVTTLQFAQLVAGIIGSGHFTPGTFHVVPADTVNKAQMLATFAEYFGRPDVTIKNAPAKEAVDRTLSTRHLAANAQRWSDAGYTSPPTVYEMIAALAAEVENGW